MKFFGWKKNIKINTGNNHFRLLENILVGGVFLLLTLLLFLILWDDYIFYKVNYRDVSPSIPGTYGEVLTVGEIEKVLNSLDRREEKLQDLLNQKPQN